MASLCRQLGALLAFAALVHTGPARIPIREMVSFDRLQASGCLPDDFTPPDLSDCLSKGGLQNTLACIADRISSEGDSEFLSSISSDETWVASQLEMLQACDQMANNLTDSELKTFRVACWRKLAEFDCRRQMMEELGSVSENDGSETGAGLAYVFGSKCLMKGLDYGSAMKQATAYCTKKEGMDWEGLDEVLDFVANYTSGLTGERIETIVDREGLTAKDVDGGAALLGLMNNTIFCIMRQMGEVSEDGSINLDTIKSDVASATGPDYLKDVKAVVADTCYKEGSTTFDDFIRCHFGMAPYACVSIEAHGIAMAPRYQKKQKRRRKGSRLAVRNQLREMVSFDRLQASGCLPDDFTPPDLSDCLSKGSLQNTLACIADRISSEGDSEFLSSISSDETWVASQLEMLQACDQMANNLTDSELKTFRVACWRKLAEFDCRRQMMEAVGSVSGNDGSETGAGLAYVFGSKCLNEGLQYGEATKNAWGNCKVEESMNWQDVAEVMEFVGEYTSGVTGEQNDQDDDVSQEDVDFARQTLSKMNDTIVCAMRKTGEVNEDGSVNLDAMKSNVASATGPQWLKDTKTKVVEMCVDDSSQTADDFIQCYFGSAPYACASIEAHKIAMAPRYQKKQKRRRNNRRCPQQGRRQRQRKRQPTRG